MNIEPSAVSVVSFEHTEKPSTILGQQQRGCSFCGQKRGRADRAGDGPDDGSGGVNSGLKGRVTREETNESEKQGTRQ
jgi:hypothetical protein